MEKSQAHEPGASGRQDPLVEESRLRSERHRRKLAEGEPSVARRLAQIGVLGWIVVVPMLIGIYVGHSIDHRYYTGILWTAPLLLLGVAIGCWSAWKWINKA